MKRLVITALSLAIAVGCASAEKSTDKESVQSAEPVKVVTKSTVAVGKQVAVQEKFTSEINAYQANSIIPAASGLRIDKIYFEVGDNVKKGDVVATLDPTQYNQQMINVENLQVDYNRLDEVYKAGGISRQTIDQAKAALDIQREVAENLKKNIELRSPISGVVTARSAEAGDLFANQSILNIAQIDSVKVNVQISEQYFTSVKLGSKVDLTLDIYPNRTFEGRVSLIYPALDAQSRTFTVEVTVPNKSLALRPGMHAYSTFSLGAKDGILIPDVAIQRQIGTADNFVYVIENGVAKRRLVKKGKIYDGDQVDILSGVEAGEEVVVTAFSRIQNGTLLSVEN